MSWREELRAFHQTLKTKISRLIRDIWRGTEIKVINVPNLSIEKIDFGLAQKFTGHGSKN